MTDKNAKKEEAKDGAAKAKEDAAPEMGKMKRGDYMIHVFIEKARQLKVPEGNTVDPIVEVTVNGERKFSTAKDDISSAGTVTWNEHLFFEPKNMSQEQIEQAKIQIRVLDKGFFKDAMIGAYDFDVTYVYFMDKHSLMHKWLALSNPASTNFTEVAGYLKMSITIAGTGDEQVQITEESGAGSDDAVLMPPSIKPEFYQLRFKFFRAEKLPAMDMAISLLGQAGSIDAFITCNYMDKKLKTRVIKQKEGGFIDWNQEFLIPCQLPIMSSRIIMKLWDEDVLTNEIVGSLLFNIKECIGQKNGLYFWKNIYGSPLGVSGETTNTMNENPEVASTWKGRILMQVQAEKTDRPLCLVKNLPKEEVEKASVLYQTHEFEIIAEVGQGVALPTAEKYNVMIKIADLELKTDKPLTAENTYNRWSTRFKQQTYKAPYKDVYDIGKVFIYLLYGDKPVCYYKAEVEEFKDPNPDWKWINLNNDQSIGKVTEAHKSGMVSIKLSIHDKTIDGPIAYDQFEAWKKPPAKRLNIKKARIYLFQCRDLPAADTDGQSDPYVKFWDTTSETKKTTIINDNLNPMFYETIELIIETNKVEDMPPFIMDVYDYDGGGLDADDFICRCVVPIKDAAYSEDDVIPRPKWYPCTTRPNGPKCGEMLCAFSVVIDDYNYKTPLEYVKLRNQVDTPEFIVDINILGLRDLQSVGILPVKKAFINFQLKSLVPPEDGVNLENVRTQPNSAGPNPTINTSIQFKLPLPKDPLFCPRLQCTVHDYIFRGFSQPMIGAFIIPIGDLIFKLAKEREEELGAIEYILQQLDLILKGEGIQSYDAHPKVHNKGQIDISVGQVNMSVQQETELFSQSISNNNEIKRPLLFQEQKDPTSFNSILKPSPSPFLSPSNLVPSPRQPTIANRTPTGKLIKNPLKQQQFDKFNSGMKGQLLQEHKDNQYKSKRDVEDVRTRDLQDFIAKQKTGGARNIFMPSYNHDPRLKVNREVDMPPDSIFMGLGWDPEPLSKKKHYRRYHPDELENIKEVMPVSSPFDSFDIKRGQSRGNAKSWWPFGSKKTDESGEVSTESVVGRFKGIVTVQSEQDKKEYQEKKHNLIHDLKHKLSKLSLKRRGVAQELKLEKLDTMEGRMKFMLDMAELGVAHLEITRHLTDLESDETLKRLLRVQTKCIVRVYMISAYDLASRDNGSFSDPYLIMNVGTKTYNERSIYLQDEPNPYFGKHYDFEAVFPGCPPLVINVMDYDDIFGDDSIGKTSVDLEDRFFTAQWQAFKNKPIEYRQIYHPSSSVSQGVVKCWIEIHPTSIPINEVPIWDIKPKPAEEFEIRVCIFDTIEIKMMDAEGTSDVYCRGYFDSNEEVKETDTHYRCQNGKASFNYRLIYNIKYPRKDYSYSLQVYDRDFFKSNDIIGEGTVNLAKAIEDCSLTNRPLCVNKDYYTDYMKPQGVVLNFKDKETFWLPVISKENGKDIQNGKVRIRIDIYPKKQADANKVGQAREEPNANPFLPPPIGRISFSLNPFTMFQQLVGPALRRKIYCYCFLIACCALCIMLGPLVVGNLISLGITKLFGG